MSFGGSAVFVCGIGCKEAIMTTARFVIPSICHGFDPFPNRTATDANLKTGDLAPGRTMSLRLHKRLSVVTSQEARHLIGTISVIEIALKNPAFPPSGVMHVDVGMEFVWICAFSQMNGILQVIDIID